MGAALQSHNTAAGGIGDKSMATSKVMLKPKLKPEGVTQDTA